MFLSFLKRALIAKITNGPGTFPIDVVGESFYQQVLSKICGGKTEEGHRHECMARLFLENKNPHDDQAVRVDIDGHTVGHLARHNARLFRKELAKAAPGVIKAQCRALIVGGWIRKRGMDEGHFGVKLDLPLAGVLTAKDLR